MVNISRGGRRIKSNPKAGSSLLHKFPCERCKSRPWSAIHVGSCLTFLCCACWKEFYLRTHPEYVKGMS